jgi:glycine cleavage system transcriptional repressor
VPELAVTAIGSDQPGIVATVAEVLRDRGGNVEDSAMTILRGRFAMVLLVETDDAPDELREALEMATGGLDLEITVAPAGERNPPSESTHVLSVYGQDRPGILAGVSRALADLEVNITDLATRMLPPEDEPVYAMVVEIALPEGLDPVHVESAIAEVSAELDVDHTLRALDAETY